MESPICHFFGSQNYITKTISVKKYIILCTVLVLVFGNYNSLTTIMQKQALTYAHGTFKFSFVKLSQVYVEYINLNHY